LQIFAPHPLDEVVFGYEIPGMSGNVAAREVKALKSTVPILILLGDDPLPEEMLKLVEAFLFQAESMPVFLAMGKTLLNKCRAVRRTFVASDRTSVEEERVLDDGLHMTAHAAALAAC
jgi:hypothetical protein